MNMITIKATSVRDNKNGTFTLEFPSVELSQQVKKTLEELFPDLLDGAYALLNKQSLLELIATSAEASAQPTKQTEQMYVRQSRPCRREVLRQLSQPKTKQV